MSNVTSGNKKVYESGTFLTSGEDPQKIIIEKGKEKISIEISFLKDPEKGQIFETEAKKINNLLKIPVNFYNTESHDNFGLTELLPIANFDNGDIISFNLWVEKLGNTSTKRISYTLYIEEKKING